MKMSDLFPTAHFTMLYTATAPKKRKIRQNQMKMSDFFPTALSYIWDILVGDLQFSIESGG